MSSRNFFGNNKNKPSRKNKRKTKNKKNVSRYGRGGRIQTRRGPRSIGKDQMMNPWAHSDPELGHQWCPEMSVPPGDSEPTDQFALPCQSSQDCLDHSAAYGLSWCGYPANDHCLHCALPHDADGGPYHDWGFGCCGCWCQ